jgi:hypothetical protein
VLEAGYSVQSVDEYLREPASRVVLLRHDIDRNPYNAVEMARLECHLGIRSTYYVRKVRGVYSSELLTTLGNLGHEVGYHYEVLAKARGDMQKALGIFEAELAELRQFVEVNTAAMHGSPLTPWNNLQIWQHMEPRELALGEPYLDIDYQRVAYYTDTGRSWDATATNLRDRVDSGQARFAQVHTTDELIALVAQRSTAQLCIQTHPERWNASPMGLLRSATMDHAASLAKRLIKKLRRPGNGALVGGKKATPTQ